MWKIKFSSYIFRVLIRLFIIRGHWIKVKVTGAKSVSMCPVCGLWLNYKCLDTGMIVHLQRRVSRSSGQGQGQGHAGVTKYTREGGLTSTQWQFSLIKKFSKIVPRFWELRLIWKAELQSHNIYCWREFRNCCCWCPTCSGDPGVKLEQGEWTAWYSVFWPGSEVVLSHSVVMGTLVVMVTDAKWAHDKVGERRRPNERDIDDTVQTCCGITRPVPLTLDDTVFHKVRQKHDLRAAQGATKLS